MALTLVTACDDGGSASPTSTSTSRDDVAPTVTTHTDDGILRLGVLTPLTGDGARLGRSVEATVQLAVDEINDAGGVNGQPVELRVADEGSDIATATAGLDQLIRQGVDAIVGPTSSTVTLSVLDTIRRHAVLACSPTATALALDDYPDDGLFFRTAPSDSLEAHAIARTIDETGRSSVGLLYVDDAYGRPFASSVRDALRARSISVTADVPFSSAESGIDTEAAVTAVADAQVIAVIGDADRGARVVSAIVEATRGSDAPIVVNDAMRGSPAADLFARLPPEGLERIVGVGPRAITEDEDFMGRLRAVDREASGLFAVNAFDCVNLIALGAVAAGTSMPTDLAPMIPSVATSGSRCLELSDCARDLLEGRNVDYDGPSGQLQLAFDGDPNRAVYDIFRFGPGGVEIWREPFLVAP